MKYEIQKIKDKEAPHGVHYRVTEIATDSRVATCYYEENAQLVCDALNRETSVRVANLESALRTGREALGVMVEVIIECFIKMSESDLDKETAKKVLDRIVKAKRVMDEALER